MDPDSRARSERDFKTEDDPNDMRMADDKPTYRSWKKKYRKMRIKFDQKMHEGEELHKLEQKALATARRLAVQKDRLLDLLLDVNNCPQIPPERRFDLRLPPSSDPLTPPLDIDLPSTPQPINTVPPSKFLANLITTIPHATIAKASESYPSLLADLAAGRDSPADPNQGLPHPPSFLTADDIDNYLYEIDVSLGVPNLLPTMAPIAHSDAPPQQPPPKDGSLSHSRDFQLRNPTSVYNWLRKHAPKTFLQDAESHGGHGGHGGHDEDHAPAPASTRGGRGKGERGPRGGGSTRGKRGGKAAAAAAAARAEHQHHGGEEGDETMAVYGDGTPTGKGAGKRKRGAGDDDPGYRPKGGSSRPPAKKKRRSDGTEGAGTGGKRPRKSGLGVEVYSAAGKGGDD